MSTLKSYLSRLKGVGEKVSSPTWKYRHGTTMDHWELWSDKEAVWEVQDDSGVEPSIEFLEFITTARNEWDTLLTINEKLVEALCNISKMNADEAENDSGDVARTP